MEKEKQKLTAGDLNIMLSTQFPAPAWAYIPQFASGTGSYCGRTADAIAFSLYPSRGLELHGFEIKVARGDWIKELRCPDKAEAIARYCHRWYIVAPEDIIRSGELPPRWGLYSPAGGKLKLVQRADLLDAAPLTLPVIASLFRRMHEKIENMVPISEIAARAEAMAATLAERRHPSGPDAQIAYLQKENEKLRSIINSFSQSSGIALAEYNAKEVGTALQSFYWHGPSRTLQNFKRLDENITTAQKQLRASIELFQAEVSKRDT